MLMFEELSDIFSDHNNHLTSRELLMKVRLLTLESIQGNGGFQGVGVGLLKFPQLEKASSDEKADFWCFVVFFLMPNLRSLGLRKSKV